jgi:hypothetical protein
MISGKQNPVVGIEEHYSVTDMLQMFETLDTKYVWAIWKKQKDGNWIDITQEPRKFGKQVTFKFGESVMGIEFRLEVYKATQNSISKEWKAKKISELIVVPTNSKIPKIDKVVLFNRGAKDPNKASYIDTLIAQAHCIAMFGQTVEFQLWEDDAKKEGHDAQVNKNNQIPGNFKATVNHHGIAEAKIPLSSNPKVLQNIANKFLMKGDKSEGANHEYYVTATFAGKIHGASKVNVNVKNPDDKPKPKDDSFIGSGTSNRPPRKDAKGKILDAYFVNSKNQRLSKVSIGDHVQIQISTQNMVKKFVQYVIWEQDNGKNDKIYTSGNIQIPGNICNTNGFTITKQTFEKGIDFGSVDPDSKIQNYFLEIIPLGDEANSRKFGVDSEIGLIEVEKVKSVSVVKKNEIEKNPKDKCFCNRDFEEKDVRIFVKLLKGKEAIWEGQALRGGKRAECNISDKSFATLTTALNNSFKKYNINHCSQKMHFLAQVCEETGTFSLSEETKSDYASSQSIYKGRGILQLTGVKKDKDDKFYNDPGPYKDYADYKGDQNIVKTPEIVANNVQYAIDSGAWVWSINKKMTNNPKSQAITKWGEKTLGKSLNELAVYVDEYLELISVLLNGRNEKTNMPNGWEKRQSNYKLLKAAFFRYDWYHGDSKKPINAKDIVTFYIYHDGKIEKHIPKTIKSGYEKKYKYVYHDKDKKEHEICTVEFILADKRNNGKTISSIPKGYIKKYQYPKGGNAQTAYVYSNGDICVEGTKYGYKQYSKGSGKVELVRMKDTLSYDNGETKVYYSFKSSQRRYCNPESYAGFIGALATLGRTDVLCTGMCFEDATSYPSVTHPNGDSADTAYYPTLVSEQKKVNAFKHFNFKNIYRGKTGWYPNLVGTKYSKGHEDHLHAGDFDSSIVKIIKE